MKLNIIYEDSDIIIVDKPAGLPTHAANEYDKRKTLVSFLISHYPQIQNVGDVGSRTSHIRPGIVHRLDKETSGLMVIAKNNEAFFELKKQFQERKIEKKYIALVSGRLEKDEGIIDIPLVKRGTKTVTATEDEGGSDPRWPSGVRPPTKIRKSTTQYKVLRRYKDYTLVEVIPKTGRMHQIRVHFASINHPIACDKLYGRKAKKCPASLRRHFLHASYLKFQLKNALMEFESELPGDLKKTLETLS